LAQYLPASPGCLTETPPSAVVFDRGVSTMAALTQTKYTTLQNLGSVVIKHTFLEFGQDDREPLASDCLGSLRCRTQSDPGMYERFCEAEKARAAGDDTEAGEDTCASEIDFELTGLSDSESHGALTSTSHPEEQAEMSSTSSTTRSGGQDAALDVDIATFESDDEDGMPQPTATGGDGCGNQRSWQDLRELLCENARLALENQLLRENAQLAQENSSLQAKQPRAEGARCGGEERTQMQKARTHPAVPPGMWLVPGQCGEFGSAPIAGGYFVHPFPEPAAPMCAEPERKKSGKSAKPKQERTSSVDCTPPIEGDERTSVMLRNLPNNYSRQMILEMLDSEGFAGKYDFIYLPIDFRTQACLGYAFLNFVEPAVVCSFWSTFDGFSRWAIPSKKMCKVTWCGPNEQGREAHIDRYRNSSVMHSAVPEDYKPLIFEGGEVVPFPEPSKVPKAPRSRCLLAAVAA